jgi:hypothetical protein
VKCDDVLVTGFTWMYCASRSCRVGFAGGAGASAGFAGCVGGAAGGNFVVGVVGDADCVVAGGCNCGGFTCVAVTLACVVCGACTVCVAGGACVSMFTLLPLHYSVARLCSKSS